MGIATLRRHRVHTHPGDGSLLGLPDAVVETVPDLVIELAKPEPEPIVEVVEKPKAKKVKPEPTELS